MDFTYKKNIWEILNLIIIKQKIMHKTSHATSLLSRKSSAKYKLTKNNDKEIKFLDDYCPNITRIVFIWWTKKQKQFITMSLSTKKVENLSKIFLFKIQ